MEQEFINLHLFNNNSLIIVIGGLTFIAVVLAAYKKFCNKKEK
jgi:hypothetical protein